MLQDDTMMCCEQPAWVKEHRRLYKIRNGHCVVHHVHSTAVFEVRVLVILSSDPDSLYPCQLRVELQQAGHLTEMIKLH